LMQKNQINAFTAFSRVQVRAASSTKKTQPPQIENIQRVSIN
jgi:hypothetical protein